MTNQEIGELLEEQLCLLSKRSQNCVEERELDGHSDRLMRIASVLLSSVTTLPTSALVEELKKREGVETHIVGPFAKLSLETNGPAVVLEVID